MPSPSTASQSRINAERLAHLMPKGNPPDSIRPEHALGKPAQAIDVLSFERKLSIEELTALALPTALAGTSRQQRLGSAWLI
jgi:hypothetical protein